MKRSHLFVVSLLMLLALPAVAQRAKPASISPETFGTQSMTYLPLNAWNFVPIHSTAKYGYLLNPDGVYLTNCCPSGDSFEAGLSLPAGAHVEYLEINFCDNSTIGGFHAQISSTDHLGVRTPGYDFAVSTDLEQTGCIVRGVTLPTPFTIDNAALVYHLQVLFTQPGSGLLLIGARVGYKLQVSTPPATPTFSDVQVSHPFYQYVEALAASGITAGCSSGQFCPDAPLTRGQMAVFLARALGLHWAP